MKRHIAALSFSLAGLAGLAGCSHEGTTGGPGAADPNAKPPIVGRQENTFALTTSSMSVKAGGTADGSIGIKRGSGFDQDVAVAFSDLPKGVTLSADKLTIPNKASEAKFVVTAADDATPGEYHVKVVGTPTSGPVSNADFKLTVKPRATFTLDPPGNALWAAGIKQGETRQFEVGVGREKEFIDDVTLKFDGMPKGVSIEPASIVVKNGETVGKMAVKVTDDAPVGNHVIKVTGHPAKGHDVTKDMTLSIVKK